MFTVFRSRGVLDAQSKPLTKRKRYNAPMATAVANCQTNCFDLCKCELNRSHKKFPYVTVLTLSFGQGFNLERKIRQTIFIKPKTGKSCTRVWEVV